MTWHHGRLQNLCYSPNSLAISYSAQAKSSMIGNQSPSSNLPQGLQINNEIIEVLIRHAPLRHGWFKGLSSGVYAFSYSSLQELICVWRMLLAFLAVLFRSQGFIPDIRGLEAAHHSHHLHSSAPPVFSMAVHAAHHRCGHLHHPHGEGYGLTGVACGSVVYPLSVG